MTAAHQLNQNILIREVGAEIVLLNTVTQQYFVASGSAVDYLRGRLAGKSHEQTVEQLVLEFQESAVQLQQDMELLLKNLQRFGIAP